MIRGLEGHAKRVENLHAVKCMSGGKNGANEWAKKKVREGWLKNRHKAREQLG